MEEERQIKKKLPKALGEYAETAAARFHMPGHKGRGLAFFRSGPAGWDLALSLFDGPGDRENCLTRSTADAYNTVYGTDTTFFLTSGEPGAVRVMTDSLRNGKKVLLASEGRFSLPEGIGLDLPSDPGLGIPALPDADRIEDALKRTGAEAVILKSPDIYGFCADFRGIADAVHRRNALLYLDASLASHFPFSGLLPEAPFRYADVSCQCPYMTLNAMNQAAAVHVNGKGTLSEQIAGICETEYPGQSCLILASLDWAVFSAKSQDWDAHMRRCIRTAVEIDGIRGLRTVRGTVLRGSAGHDGSRIVVDVSGRGLSGYSAKRILQEKGIFAQTADGKRVVFLTSPEDDPEWYPMLLNALSDLPEGNTGRTAGKRMKKSSVRREDTAEPDAEAPLKDSGDIGETGQSHE